MELMHLESIPRSHNPTEQNVNSVNRGETVLDLRGWHHI